MVIAKQVTNFAVTSETPCCSNKSHYYVMALMVLQPIGPTIREQMRHRTCCRRVAISCYLRGRGAEGKGPLEESWEGHASARRGGVSRTASPSSRSGGSARLSCHLGLCLCLYV